jgi:hypothetical protein
VQGNDSDGLAVLTESFGIFSISPVIAEGEDLDFVAPAEVLDLMKRTDLVALVWGVRDAVG